MNELQLPDLSPEAAPEFTDAATVKAWLEHVPLANVAAAQHQLLTQLQEFNQYATSAPGRLAALEALREAVQFVEIEQARRFTNRALPMAEAESAVFDDTLALWEEMHLGYQRCLAATIADEAGMRAQGGLVCQRALSYTGLKMFHYHRAYRQVPPRVWRELHEGFARAEVLGVAEDAVKDYLNRDVNETSPRVAYLRAMLLGMANPNELSQRQLTFVAFLLERWADKVELSKEAPADEEIAPLVIDLESDFCPEREGQEASEARYVGVNRLAKSLRNRIGLLRKGESPAKLALGEDCVQPSCEQLLVHLYRHWCAGKPTRALERRRVSGEAEACSELSAIHHYIAGRVFRPPGEEAAELTQKQRQEIATFGRVSTREEEEYSGQHGFVMERWKIEDESAQGLRLVRAAAEPGKRLAHGQLIGVRPVDSKQFMLAHVRWVMTAENGDLQAGVKLLPGIPSPLAVRPTGLNVQPEAWVPALGLSGVPALNAQTSLILAPGTYKPKRVIEIHAGGSSKARLTEVMERGVDFERVTYEVVP